MERRKAPVVVGAAGAASAVDGFAAPALPYARRACGATNTAIATVLQPAPPADAARNKPGPGWQAKARSQGRGHGAAQGAARWEAQLAWLAAYEAAHGDCKVPRRWPEDPRLANWVDNQRYNKKRLDRGECGLGMTAERAAKLEALGFCWDRQGSGSHVPDDTKWEAQLARLAAFKVAHGDCSVLQGWGDDPRLTSWVNQQRSLKEKLDRGEPSKGLTAERVAKLEVLGFVWEASTSHWDEAAGMMAAVAVPLVQLGKRELKEPDRGESTVDPALAAGGTYMRCSKGCGRAFGHPPANQVAFQAKTQGWCSGRSNIFFKACSGFGA